MEDAVAVAADKNVVAAAADKNNVADTSDKGVITLPPMMVPGKIAKKDLDNAIIGESASASSRGNTNCHKAILCNN